MAYSDRKETFITSSPGIIEHCCCAMYRGGDALVEISGITIAGQVQSVRRMDDGQFQISIRLAI